MRVSLLFFDLFNVESNVDTFKWINKPLLLSKFSSSIILNVFVYKST